MHIHTTRALVLVLVVALSRLAAAQTGGDGGLKNADFAGDEIGAAPSGWIVAPAGAAAKVVEDGASPTKRSMELRAAQRGEAVGNLMQQIDARPFRGKRVIVRADLRLAPHESLSGLRERRAQMWVRIDRENGQVGFFDNMSDRPVRGLRAMNYQTYAINGVVDEDATVLNIGVLVFGEAVAHVARFRLDIAEADARPDAPPSPATARGVDNLVALAKLYGYVRYFHASDESAEAPWDHVLIGAVERVEGAKDAAGLAAALGEVFAPLAPSVQVWAGSEGAAPAAPGKPEGAVGFTAWHHFGVDVQGQAAGRGLYTSRRVNSPLAEAGDGTVKPGTAVIKTLGGGVWCRVPVAVYTDEAMKTLPRAKGKAPEAQRPEWWSPNAGDRSARLGGVVAAWNILQHFYPYWAETKTDWGAALRGALATAATDADGLEYLKTLQRLVSRLDDGHGSVTPINTPLPKPFNLVFDWVGDRLVVARVGEGEEGIKAGDEVVAVAGVPTGEWYEGCRGRISAATEQWARWRACSTHTFFGLGKEPVELTLRRGGKEFKASPARITSDMPLREERPADGSEVAPGIVYFNLDGAEEKGWREALPALEKAKGIILDMRGYPGSAGTLALRHLAESNLQSAKWIVPETTLPDQEGLVWNELKQGRWNLPPAEPALGRGGQKVVFITDGRTISYAESCMAIVEAYKLGEIVGGTTAGTNGNVNPFSVCGGYYISWTGMKVVKHDDSRHHGVGVAPTIPAQRTVEGIAAARDELLEAAIKAAGGAGN